MTGQDAVLEQFWIDGFECPSGVQKGERDDNNTSAVGKTFDALAEVNADHDLDTPPNEQGRQANER